MTQVSVESWSGKD